MSRSDVSNTGTSLAVLLCRYIVSSFFSLTISLITSCCAFVLLLTTGRVTSRIVTSSLSVSSYVFPSYNHGQWSSLWWESNRVNIAWNTSYSACGIYLWCTAYAPLIPDSTYRLSFFLCSALCAIFLLCYEEISFHGGSWRRFFVRGPILRVSLVIMGDLLCPSVPKPVAIAADPHVGTRQHLRDTECLHPDSLRKRRAQLAQGDDTHCSHIEARASSSRKTQDRTTKRELQRCHLASVYC